MANQLAVDVRHRVSWLLRDAGGLSTVSEAAEVEYARGWIDGVGVDEADAVWHQEAVLTAGESATWELSGLSRQVFGGSVPVAFARIKLLLLVNLATGVEERLVLREGATHGWRGPFATQGSGVEVAADSSVLLVNRRRGWPVTAGTADRLVLRNDGLNPARYQVLLVGTSVSDS